MCDKLTADEWVNEIVFLPSAGGQHYCCGGRPEVKEHQNTVRRASDRRSWETRHVPSSQRLWRSAGGAGRSINHSVFAWTVGAPSTYIYIFLGLFDKTVGTVLIALYSTSHFKNCVPHFPVCVFWSFESFILRECFDEFHKEEPSLTACWLFCECFFETKFDILI